MSSSCVGTPGSNNRNSGKNDPSAERKNNPDAIRMELRLPKRLAKRPESEPPITHPIKALAAVIPWITSVYRKSVARRKKASKPFSAPEITAVS